MSSTGALPLAWHLATTAMPPRHTNPYEGPPGIPRGHRSGTGSREPPEDVLFRVLSLPAGRRSGTIAHGHAQFDMLSYRKRARFDGAFGYHHELRQLVFVSGAQTPFFPSA